MKSGNDLPPDVLVVLDPGFGERLRDVRQGQPVWITMSPANAPVVHALSATSKAQSHLTGITGFRYDQSIAPEDWLVSQLATIELHHGSYSAPKPFTVLRVVGAQLTVGIRDALCELGFSTFEQSKDGFVASRSDEEARRRRGPI
jgi:hypothetical protein